jgi:YVTN family beta-propeller protein
VPVLPATPPHPIPILSGFDYVTADPLRHRIYAAHTASDALTVIDATSGAVLGQIDVGGGPQGVAVDPKTGDVFTGNSTARTIAKVDPKAMQVIGSVDVAGPVDAVAYDPALHRVYADEDDGTRIFVIDGATMKQIGVVNLPGHKPEFLDVDPATHAVYQNIADLAEIAVVDPKTLTVARTIPTPAVKKNHPLQFDPKLDEIVVAGKNGVLAAYSPAGKLLGSLKVAPDFDQCSLDRARHVLACAGGGNLSVFALHAGAAPTLVGETTAPDDAHTLAIDPVDERIWLVWASAKGDFERAFAVGP